MTKRGRGRSGTSQTQRNLTDRDLANQLETQGIVVEDYHSSSESDPPNPPDQQPILNVEIPLDIPMAQRPPPNNNNIPNAINPPNANANPLPPPNLNNGAGEQRGEHEIPRPRRTIKEVLSRGVTHDPFEHAYPHLVVDFEIKSPLIAALPHFAGLDREDAYGHLHSFHLACASMKPPGANIEDVQLKVFHLTLDGNAREWFRLLPQQDPDALTSWVNLRRAFLEHFFTDDRTAELKKEIFAIKQDPSESFYEYWCRYQQLLAKIPHHQICDEELISYFHMGLLSNERGIIDATAGGCLSDVPAEEAWQMIKTRAKNTKNYGRRGSKGVFELQSTPQHSKRMDTLETKVDNLSTHLSSQLHFITSELRNLSMQQLTPSSTTPATSKALVAPSCEHCGSVMHISSLCPGEPEEVNAMFQGRSPASNQKWDPQSNTYNEGWRSHPNFRWRDNSNAMTYNGQASNPSQKALVPHDSPRADDINLQILKTVQQMREDMNSSNSRNDARFTSLESKMEQWETRANNLQSFVTQLSDSLSDKQARSSGASPSNTVINPKSLNAITLRSGNRVKFQDDEIDGDVDEEIICEAPPSSEGECSNSKSPEESLPLPTTPVQSESLQEKKLLPTSPPSTKFKRGVKFDPPLVPTTDAPQVNGKEVKISDLPFPHSYLASKRVVDDKCDKEMFDMFSKVEVNLPLLDLIKKMPKSAKFLKDLCTNKRRYKHNERIQLGSNVSALFKPQLPLKCKDPGSYTIPCTIGKTNISNALLDLGAAINVMPTSIFESLGSQSIKQTSVVLQLADRTIRYPKGILEDILVQVKGLVFPADFYVLDMTSDNPSDSTLILGRPFLRTAETIIDMKQGTITMGNGDQEVKFLFSEAMRGVRDDCSYLGISAISVVDDEIDSLCDALFANSFDHIEPSSIISSLQASSCCDCDGDVSCVACVEINEFLSTSHYPDVDDSTCFVDIACAHPMPSGLGIVSSTYDDAGASDHIGTGKQATPVASPMMEICSVLGSGEPNAYGDAPIPPSPLDADAFLPLAALELQELVPSVVKPPMVDLKPLPSNLKYVFLADDEKLPVIISNALSDVEEGRLVSLLKSYRGAIGWSLADIPGINPSVCTHRILLEEGSKPIRQPQRRLNPLILDVVRKEVAKLLSAGIIYPISDSEWVSPVQVVPKKSGITIVRSDKDELIPTRIQNSWRVCIDYRKLNASTRKDHFPLPFIDQMLERISGKSHYCFLDGFSGYFQVPIAPEDQEKTTFTCPFGTFAYRRMPFGLCNAPGTFQRCMMSIFSDLLEHNMEVFMDDFTVYGSSFDECLSSLELVLKRCLEKNLVLNYEKCHFMVDSGIVLGHLISQKGIEVDKAKIEVISSLPYPTNLKEVRSFLGHAGFYRRFIANFSKIALPLSSLLKKDCDFIFDDKCKHAFDSLKAALVSPPIISAPNWHLPFEISCDASNYAVGAMLGQRVDKVPKVIAYASRTLDCAQVNYTTTEKELFAVIFALDKFRQYLLHSSVVVYTDHAAVRYLFQKPQSKARLLRWALLMQEFDLKVKDRAGAENHVADHLSRLPPDTRGVDCSDSCVDSFPDSALYALATVEPWYAHIVNYLTTDVVPSSMSQYQVNKLRREAKYYIWDAPVLWRVCSDQIIRRCVPNDEIHSILTHAHSLSCGGHFSSRKTARRVLECGFFWPTLFKDAFVFCKSCEKCQQFGSWGKRHEMPMQPIHFCEIFDVWGIDFMGPFPPSFGFSYILLAVDYVSRWVEAIPTRKDDAPTVSKFLRSHIFCRYGIPRAIISDQGTHFCNRIIQSLLAKYGVTHKFATPYHPQTNGLAEVSNREVKHILEKIVKPNRKDWSDRLEEALWAYRTAFKTPIGTSPFRIVYGKACHLPMELEHKSYWAIKACNADLKASLANRMMQLQELEELRLQAYDNGIIYKDKLKRIHDKNILRKHFQEGDKVMMYLARYKIMPGKFKARWQGPYKIVKVFPYGAYELMDEVTGLTFKANGHLLKHFHEPSPSP